MKVIEKAENIKPVEESEEIKDITEIIETTENSLDASSIVSTNSFELPEELTNQKRSKHADTNETNGSNRKIISDLKRCQFRNFRHFGKSVINFHLSKNYNKKSSFAKTLLVDKSQLTVNKESKPFECNKSDTEIECLK